MLFLLSVSEETTVPSSSIIRSFCLSFPFFLIFFSKAFFFSYSALSVLILNLSCSPINSLMSSFYFVIKNCSTRLISSRKAWTQLIVSLSDSSMISSLSSGTMLSMSFLQSSGTNLVYRLVSLFVCFFSTTCYDFISATEPMNVALFVSISSSFVLRLAFLSIRVFPGLSKCKRFESLWSWLLLSGLNEIFRFDFVPKLELT